VSGHNAAMGRVLRVVGWLLAAFLTLAGWLGLVFVAIDAGLAVRDGDSDSWWTLVPACVGAIALLILATYITRRLLVALGVARDYQPKRARRR